MVVWIVSRQDGAMALPGEVCRSGDRHSQGKILEVGLRKCVVGGGENRRMCCLVMARGFRKWFSMLEVTGATAFGVAVSLWNYPPVPFGHWGLFKVMHLGCSGGRGR